MTLLLLLAAFAPLAPAPAALAQAPPAAQEAPADPAALLARAVSLHQAGDVEAAVVLYERVLGMMQLAVVYHRLGRTEDSARARAAVGRIQSEGENRFFKGVSDALSRLLGKTTAP